MAITVVVVVSGCAQSDRIRTVQDVPDDVAVIVADVWADLEDRLPWAAQCMQPVEVFLAREVPDGAARYRPGEQLLEIQIPTSPRRFRESLVHELAHHIDATCPGLESLRAAFTAAQGLDPSQPWDEGATWEVTPAEHFAEAVVGVVNGERILHGDRIELTGSALDLLRGFSPG